MLIERSTFHPDQHGFYTVGSSFKTYSKLEAMQEMQRTGVHLEWNFNQEIFKSYNWYQEPSTDLAELYRQRAQQIRDSYDYIVVFYSGGADSWNIVNTFLSNDIKLDEIAHCWSLKGDGTYTSYFNEEVYRVAIPTTLKIQQQHPHIYHRIIDITDMVTEAYASPGQGFDFIYHVNNLASPNGLARSYLREKIKDYAELINSGKRVAFVWGTEKPRLSIKNGRYHCFFVDMFDNTVSNRVQLLGQEHGWYDELFYWSPAAVPLIIKQCHLLRKFLKQADPGHPWVSDQRSDFGKLRNYSSWITPDGLHSLIYPGWDVNTFSNGKNNQNVFGPRDNWFWNRHHNAHISLQRFQNGVEKLFQMIDPYWFKNKQDWRLGIKSCINEYALEP